MNKPETYQIYGLSVSYEGADKQIIKLTEMTEYSDKLINESWRPYFTDIFTSLKERSDSTGITKSRLHEYIALPGLIYNAFFRVLNKSKTLAISLEEFLSGLLILYFGKFEDKVSFIFQMYDYNTTGSITKEDIRSLMSYVPLANYIESKHIIKEGNYTSGGGNIISYYDKLQAQSDMVKLFSIHIPSKPFTLIEFTSIVESSLSDIFLAIYMMIRKNLPTFEQIISQKKPMINQIPESKITHSPPIRCVSPKIEKLLITSAINSHSPVMKSTGVAISSITDFSKKVGSNNSFLKQVLQNTSKTSQPAQINYEAIRMPNTSIIISKNEKVNVTLSPSLYLDSQTMQNKMSVMTCECGNLCHIGETRCLDCKETKYSEMEGYIYMHHDGTKLKRFYFKLKGKELSYEEIKGDPSTIKIVPLHSMSIEEGDPIDSDKFILFPFQINDDIHIKRMYTVSLEERTKWVCSLKKTLGIKCIHDYYVFNKDLGGGKFGKIKLAMHKASKKSVAIKIVEKTSFDDKERELLFNECEILKVCHHPNIVKLLDIFANPSTTFMVMEFSMFGDLFNFLEKKSFNLTEEMATSMMIEIANGIKYLHSMNIVHRDIKPENILLMDSEAMLIKITDFGLSKIIHNNEVCTEPFGTVTYVSPELLLKKPYSKSVDVWSLGVLYYLMLGGCFPFDDDKLNIVMKKIVEVEPNYAEGKWKNISPEAKQLVKRMLSKSPVNRCNIEDVLNDIYIQKHLANKSVLHK